MALSHLVRFELLPHYQLSMVEADNRPPPPPKQYCTLTLLSTWRIVWREGFSCCGGKTSILAGKSFFWQEDPSFRQERSRLLANFAHVAKLFWHGVFAGRQIHASCKVVLARSLQSTASHKGTNIKIVHKISTEGIHSKRNATNLI